MAYDLIKQKHPGAPCAVGARVRHRETGRTGNVAPQRAGVDAILVRFDGEAFPKPCAPNAIAYLDGPPSASDPWCGR